MKSNINSILFSDNKSSYKNIIIIKKKLFKLLYHNNILIEKVFL